MIVTTKHVVVDQELFKFCISDSERIALQAIIEHGTAIKASRELGRNDSYCWKKYNQVKKRAARDGHTTVAPASLEPQEPLAARQERRLRDEMARLKRERDQANRDANKAEDLRDAVFGLGKPFDPMEHPLPFIGDDADGAEIAMLFQSDEQWGEVIKREEMGGLNAYNRDIASARYKRLIEATIKCCLPPHSTSAPPIFYYLMGGDSLSGSIHEELAETNDLSSIPAVKDYCTHVRWGIETLKRELGCPIRVIRVPGNHDRLTKKPRHKGYNEHSLDTIISWHLEMLFENDPDVTFFIPPENDAYFQVYDYNFLLTHGDMMGTGGGTGYIGAVAPITKGHRKLVETYLQAGKPVDYVLTGHFHTAVETEYGFGNGCLPGFSEYARLKIRAKPSAPVQWLLHIHPDHGVTTRRQIMVAAPDEGDLYQPRRAPA
jgi:hypothetical protein